MKIKVTQEHIDKGEPQDPQSCPIARAMKTAKLKNPIVGASLMSWGLSKERKRISQPLAVFQWRTAFDRGNPVLPFEFEI